MKKVICKKTYDTENAQVVKKVAYGAYGDPDGYEETLYVTEEGSYFLYVNGGANSIYSTEKLTRKSKAAAEKWLKENE